MASGYGRLEFIKRSLGRNTVQKAAYNARERLEFEGNVVMSPAVYDWSHKEKAAYHEILLPSHVNEKFKSMEFLWNAVERKELRKDSQVAMEVLLALPDDLSVSVEQKIELAKGFIEKHFVSKGLISQINIHYPNKSLEFSKQTGEFVESRSNWHAHVLITTRRIKENGLEFEDVKARDLMPDVRKGKVVLADPIGKEWTQYQNDFFKEKAIPLTVDPTGIIPQEHIGPYRFRGRSHRLIERNEVLKEENRIQCQYPGSILDKLTENKSVFTEEDFIRFVEKHIEDPHHKLHFNFFHQPEIVPLYQKVNTKFQLIGYTSRAVVKEEEKILRIADRIQQKPHLKINVEEHVSSFSSYLSAEQKTAFKNILSKNGLNCIQGFAGTGKSYLLVALKRAYEKEGFHVRAFGPDNATSNVLKTKGFHNAENIYAFTFGVHNEQREINKGREIWIVDEAGKLGNRPLLELLKQAEKHDAQVIFSGCTSQISPVERGEMFRAFCERYGCQVLENIQRQKSEKHRELARTVSVGNMGIAIDQLKALGGLKWVENKKELFEKLINQWAVDRLTFPGQQALIIANSNKEVQILNDLAHIVRKVRNELGEKEIRCITSFGEINVSEGDLLEFRKNDKELGVINGLSGVLVQAEKDCFTVSVKEEDSTRLIKFNPEKYHSFHLGYASTCYRSQGNTVDRVYIAHNCRMNRETFYVGTTRHTENVKCFVSIGAIGYLAGFVGPNVSEKEKEAWKSMGVKEKAEILLRTLKSQVNQEMFRSNVSDYTHLKEIIAEEKIKERLERIESLKNSNSFVGKLAGYGLSAWNDVQSKVKDAYHGYFDKQADSKFFNPSISETTIKAIEGSDPSSDEPLIITDKPLKEKASPQQDLLDELNDSDIKQLKETIINNELKLKEQLGNERPPISEAHNPYNLSSLTKEQQVNLSNYFKIAEAASHLHSQVEDEAKKDSKEMRLAKQFKEWQQVCGRRNQTAHEIMSIIGKGKIEAVVGEKPFKIIEDQASRHEAYLNRGGKFFTSGLNKLTDDYEKEPISKAPQNKTRSPETQLTLHVKKTSHLSTEQKEGLAAYCQSFEKASKIYLQAKEEEKKENKALRHCPSFKEWLQAAAKRNETAFQLKNAISREDLEKVLGKKDFNVFKEQALEHENYLKHKLELSSNPNQLPLSPPISKEEPPISKDKIEEKDAKKETLPTQLVSSQSQANSHKQLSKEGQQALSLYFKFVNEASALHSMAKSEAEEENKDMRKTTHFKSWQEACGKRNEAAYQLKKTVESKDLEVKLGKPSLKIIEGQSLTHEAFLNRSRSLSSTELNDRLRENIEPLVYRLFPEGPTFKDQKQFRFGSKGSLCITFKGEGAGTFFSFKEMKGGNYLTLIQKEFGFNHQQAREWAIDFLGVASDIPIPTGYIKSNVIHNENAKDWISLKPDYKCPAPALNDIPGSKVSYVFNETARYAYKDEEGNLLFYTLRLVKKDDPSAKSFRHLSYGYHADEPNKPQWNLKGFDNGEKKPLYNLGLLKQNPLARVLIVEGEKATDAAQEMLKDKGFVCLSWVGGAGSASKSDWSPLIGRDVVIWPDNDEAGFKAEKQVSLELKKVGVKSLKTVDHKILQEKFPKKWDLADPLPSGIDKSIIKDMLMLGKDAAINPEKLVSELKFMGQSIDNSFKEKAKINELLWRVDERLRPHLEKELGERSSEVNNRILSATTDIIKERPFLEEKLQKQFDFNSEHSKRATYQCMLHKAEHGKDVTSCHIENIKQALHKMDATGVQSLGIAGNKELSELAIDKTLHKHLSSPLTQEISKQVGESVFTKDVSHTSNNLVKQAETENLVKAVNNTVQVQKQQDQGIDR